MAFVTQTISDGPNFYKMFKDGSLDYTNSTHKAWLDEYYNQLVNAPDIEIFEEKYVTYLRTYHPYMMRASYGANEASI